MEELYVYAVLMFCCYGDEYADLENEYENLLDKLFLNNPENPDYLELEILSGNMKESIIYIFSHTDSKSFNSDKFGKILMSLLQRVYECIVDLEKFSKLSYSLWQCLPSNIQIEEPFFMLSYADEPISWGDFEQSKELYEEMFNYYKKL